MRKYKEIYPEPIYVRTDIEDIEFESLLHQVSTRDEELFTGEIISDLIDIYSLMDQMQKLRQKYRFYYNISL